MNPLNILWLASALGAALFFASGFLTASARPAAPRIDAELLEELEAELVQAQAQHVAQTAQLGELQRRLQHSEQSGLALQQALEQAHAEYARLDAQHRGHADAAERISLLEQENSRLHDKVSSLRPPDLELGSKLARLESEHLELKDEVVPLRQAASSVPVLRMELDELRRALDEKARAQADAEQRARTLRTELERMRSEAPRKPAPRSGTRDSLSRSASVHRARQSGTAPRVSTAESTLEVNLERQLSALAARDAEVSAVLADARGFSIAGVGAPEHQRELSVVACLAQDLARRAENLLAMEHIQFMHMAGGARALRVRFLPWENQLLALGSLTSQGQDLAEEEEKLAACLPQLLFAAKSA